MKVDHQCLNCNKSDNEAPILAVRFKSQDLQICTSCLPILIHRPQQLVGRLDGIESVEPAGHSHD